jgi:hypothetical protein
MALSIRKQSVEHKARDLAARRGLSMTGAIEQALDNELARDEARFETEVRETIAMLRENSRVYMAAPSTGLTEQDIMGWDEDGLPN